MNKNPCIDMQGLFFTMYNEKLQQNLISSYNASLLRRNIRKGCIREFLAFKANASRYSLPGWMKPCKEQVSVKTERSERTETS